MDRNEGRISPTGGESMHGRLPQTPELLRERLLRECNVETSHEATDPFNRKVSFVARAGAKPIDILQRAQTIASKLYGNDAVWSTRLEKWGDDPDFVTPFMNDQKIEVIGCVSDTINKTREEQRAMLEALGYPLASVRDLALGHALFLVATGDNLLGVHSARAADGTLYYIKYGLSLDCFDKGASRSELGAAACPC